MRVKEIIKLLRQHANPKNVEGMARFGINCKNTLGVSVPALRQMARKIGKNPASSADRHQLAQELWQSGLHEARILAGLIDEPKLVTKKQMDNWAKDFDSWDICDQVCMNLFDKTPFAYTRAKKWTKDNREFVRRAGFALVAALSVHDKKADDKLFLQFFPMIKKYATDERNFVRKAVNWALRQIGKRNKKLGHQAALLARQIQKIDSKTAKWVAGDALREFKVKGIK